MTTNTSKLPKADTLWSEVLKDGVMKTASKYKVGHGAVYNRLTRAGIDPDQYSRLDARGFARDIRSYGTARSAASSRGISYKRYIQILNTNGIDSDLRKDIVKSVYNSK